MADSTIPSMTAAGTLDGTELYYGVQSSADRKVTGAQIKTLVSNAPTIAGHPTIEGVTSTGATGTGKLVFDGTPTLVTPVIGAATGTSLTVTGALTTGTQGTTQGSVVLANTNSTFATTVKSSNSASAAYTITLPTTAGTSGYVLETDGTGVTSWAQLATGPTIGTTTVTSGTGTRLLYETSGHLVGEVSGATSDGTTLTLVAPVLGAATGTSLALGGATLGANALAITGHVLVEGVTSTGATGTGKIVFDGTPTLVTPVLGAATATSINGNTFTTGTYTLTGTAGKTLTFSNSITLAGTDSTTMTFPGASASIGYLGVPFNGQNAGYTTVLSDAGKCIYMQTAGTFTIDSHTNVAYPVGTVLTFINGSTSSTIPITSDTMTLAGSATTGTRTLAANGIATAVKTTTSTWIISGTGLT